MSQSNEKKIESYSRFSGNVCFSWKNFEFCVGRSCDPVVIAGPCAIETRDQAFRIAEFLSNLGVKIYRGGAFKPRTSPNSFQGLERKGLEILQDIKEHFGLLICSELTDLQFLDEVLDVFDIVQVGSRNMQYFPLLQSLGRVKKPVLLKRHFGAKIDELLMSAEYIRKEGNENIILCERGIRTFETSARNTLDILAIPVIHEKSSFPIIVDPSHATGNRNYVESMALASLSAGADGLIVEVHDDPDNAWVDGPQSLTLSMFGKMFHEIRKLGFIQG